MRKSIYLILILFLFFNINGLDIVYAENEEDDIEQQLTDSINEQIGSLDFSELQSILDGLSDNSITLFGSISFWDKITQMLNSDFGNGYTNFFQAIINSLFENTLGFIPLLATIVIVTILCGIIGNLRNKDNINIGQIIDFVCFGIIVVLVSSVVIGLLQSSTSLMNSLQKQMDIIFPMLLTFLATVGGTVSVGIFQPAVAILSNVIVQVFINAIIPLFVFLFVLIIINNISHSVKLDKLVSFISSMFKWLAGVCFSVFLGVLAIQGVVAGSFDGVSIKATRFAIKSYVPILGGYLSDGLNVAIASGVLIKNVVGVGGILLLCATILTPVFQIIVCSLLLKLTAGILEPISADSKISNFLQQISKLLGLLLMIILAIAFMYIITIGLMLCTANVF